MSVSPSDEPITTGGRHLLRGLSSRVRMLGANGSGSPRLLLLSMTFATCVVAAQVARPATDDAWPVVETEQGIPVTDKLTLQKCGTCHTPDAKGNLSRISWVRSTPEGWAQTIKRMVALHHAPITPADAKPIIRYLATAHGLAPEEAKSVMYIAERRIIDETNIPNDTVRAACASCHAFGQALSSRRTRSEWSLLQNMHVALYSQADAQYRRPVPTDGPPLAEGVKPPLPGAVALDYLTKAAPLATPEWAAWQPRLRAPRLTDTWLVSAMVPGKGRFVGEMKIAPGADPETFTTTTTLRSLATGETISRKGSGILYAGYSWRGNSRGSLNEEKPDDLQSVMRETMWFAPDQKMAEGRWYWGEYHEFGIDVKLTRVTAAPSIASVTPYAVKAGSRNVSVRILGANLPRSLSAKDIDFGPGVTVTAVSSTNPSEAIATIDVAADALAGQRDVAVGSAILQKGLPIYRKIDFLKVTPETGLARLGGIKFAKGYQQFDVIGFDKGLDGKPNTADDVALGPVDVTWQVEEFATVYYDDDKSFVGSLTPNALFVPAVEGANSKRLFGRNNYGEVWVVATAKNEKDQFGKPLTARAYLVVSVPSYLRRDQPEVSQ